MLSRCTKEDVTLNNYITRSKILFDCMCFCCGIRQLVLNHLDWILGTSKIHRHRRLPSLSPAVRVRKPIRKRRKERKRLRKKRKRLTKKRKMRKKRKRLRRKGNRKLNPKMKRRRRKRRMKSRKNLRRNPGNERQSLWSQKLLRRSLRNDFFNFESCQACGGLCWKLTANL